MFLWPSRCQDRQLANTPAVEELCAAWRKLAPAEHPCLLPLHHSSLVQAYSVSVVLVTKRNGFPPALIGFLQGTSLRVDSANFVLQEGDFV